MRTIRRRLVKDQLLGIRDRHLKTSAAACGSFVVHRLRLATSTWFSCRERLSSRDVRNADEAGSRWN